MPALAQVDIIWQNAATGQTSYWTMNGATSTSAAVLLTDANWRVTASADLNGDGQSDLLWYNAATGQTSYWMMNGSAMIASGVLLTDPNWKVAATGDLNGDGKSDIIWQNAATGQTSYWMMNGATYTSAAVLLTHANWRVTASADLNGDGKSDLLWYNAATGQTSYWMMNGATYTSAAVLLTNANWRVAGTRVAGCQEGIADPQSNAPRVCHDLDGDGVVDTSVTFANGQLMIRGARTRDIALGAPAEATLKTVTTIGDYAGGPLHELAVRVDTWTGANGNLARLFILDLDAINPVIASLTQPFATPAPAYVAFPRAADGRRIPVMVGGVEQANVVWHYLCRFQPGFNDDGCGQGFAKWSTVPPGATQYRRHQGAWIQDTNGDGFEDLHLPFYSVYTSNRSDGGVLTISMANNQQTWTRLNMAEMARDGEELHGESHPPSWASLSGSAQGFDSGRLYGAVSSFRVDGRDKALMIGGNPVGYFPISNTSSEAWLVFCNVARYVGVIGNPQAQIGARTLEWGWYLGFNQSVFANNSGNGALLKDGYMAHGCIHRYSDARVQSSQGIPSVAFNVFRSADFNGQSRCEAEQRALFNGGFTDSLQETYRACVIGNASKSGRWIVQFLDESDGSGRTALWDAYMWGYSNQLLPGGKFVHVIETLGGAIPFNRAGVPSTTLRAFTLESSPSWQVQQVATLPVAGRPAIRVDDYASYPLVADQKRNGDFAHLVTRPNLSVPGLVDIQMANGQWVGYSTTAAALVAK
jgi:hypothetical protein